MYIIILATVHTLESASVYMCTHVRHMWPLVRYLTMKLECNFSYYDNIKPIIMISSVVMFFFQKGNWGVLVVWWLSSWLLEQSVESSSQSLATTFSEIEYLLLPSRGTTEISSKEHKSSKRPEQQNQKELLSMYFEDIYSCQEPIKGSSAFTWAFGVNLTFFHDVTT